MAERTAVVDGARATRLVSLNGLAKAAISPRMIAIIWAAAILHGALIFSKLPARTNQPDFSHYYASALALRENLNPYTLDLKSFAAKLGLDVGWTTRASYTPTFLLCFEPLTLLSPRTAYWTWFGLNVFFLTAALLLLLGRSPGPSGRAAWVIAAIAILYPPLEIHFYYAQSQILVLLMLVLMMRSMERRRDALAGLILALAGLLRGFPLVMAAYLVVCRRWPAVIYTALSLAAGGIITMIFVGATRSIDFIHAVSLITSPEFIARPANIALGSFVSRCFWYAAPLHAEHSLDLARRLVATFAELGLLTLTVKATFANTAGEDHDWRSFSLWIVAMIMLSPTAWLHYMVLLLIPFILVVFAAARGRAMPQTVWAVACSYMLIAVAMLVAPALPNSTPSWVKMTVEECGFVSLLVAYIGVYWFAVGGRNLIKT